jgi:hypothetical protein
MRNLIKQHESEETRTDIGSPQYVWSWTVYFLRHIGRPALADEVRKKFKNAHPDLEKKCGGRAIGNGREKEWLSVPVAMAAAFPNGELSTAYQSSKRSKKLPGAARSASSRQAGSDLFGEDRGERDDSPPPPPISASSDAAAGGGGGGAGAGGGVGADSSRRRRCRRRCRCRGSGGVGR